jgi:hypothetical protein
MARKNPILTTENRINVCRDYTKLWAEFFKFFAEGLQDKKITEKDEVAFDRLISLLALNHFKFTELMGSRLKDPDAILDVLADAVSLSNLKAMSEAQSSKLQIDWHTLFIEMNKCLGKLNAELPAEKKAAPKPAVKTAAS